MAPEGCMALGAGDAVKEGHETKVAGRPPWSVRRVVERHGVVRPCHESVGVGGEHRGGWWRGGGGTEGTKGHEARADPARAGGLREVVLPLPEVEVVVVVVAVVGVRAARHRGSGGVWREATRQDIAPEEGAVSGDGVEDVLAGQSQRVDWGSRHRVKAVCTDRRGGCEGAQEVRRGHPGAARGGLVVSVPERSEAAEHMLGEGQARDG